MEDTWVDHLLGVLVAVLQWLQPLLTPNNYDALVASLLLKASSAPFCHDQHLLMGLYDSLQGLGYCAIVLRSMSAKRCTKWRSGLAQDPASRLASRRGHPCRHIHFEWHIEGRISSRQVVDRLEATLSVKRFNQLGGLQLDRDVRHLINTLSEVSPCRNRGMTLASTMQGLWRQLQCSWEPSGFLHSWAAPQLVMGPHTLCRRSWSHCFEIGWQVHLYSF